MEKPTKFTVVYCDGSYIDKGFYRDYKIEKLGEFASWEEASKFIQNHPKYKKSYFTKKGNASSRNPNEHESFSIVDNKGQLYYIR